MEKDKTLNDFLGQDMESLGEQLANQTLSDDQLILIGNATTLKEKVTEIVKTVYDPEIPVSIWELGLIYKLEVDGNNVTIDMTLTAPSCPVAGAIPVEVKKRIETYAPECDNIEVNLVWEPKWTQDRMSEEAQLELGLL